jgi:fermentation-respiration switch protein FrsA (DUF1100 family)
MALFQRSPTTIGAVAAPLVAGIAGLAAAMGLAGPHAVKGGQPALIVGGVVLAIACGVLVASAIRNAARRSRLGLAVAAVAAVALGAVAVAVVTVPVMLTHAPRPDVGTTTPSDLGADYVDVEVPARDGTVLSGWYLPSTTGAAVVLRHGSGSTRSNVLDHGVVLARHGLGVLLLDARGHGRSGGRAMEAGWFGDDDVIGAVDWLARRDDVDPTRIAVVGLSMGGEEAIGAAAADERIAAVVAEGATGRVADDFGWLSAEYGLRGTVQQGIEHAQQAVTGMLTRASAPTPLREAVAAAAPRPVLLIAGGDEHDEIVAARWIEDAAPASVSLWVVPGSGHTDGLDTDPRAWEARVVAFLAPVLAFEGGLP